MKIVVGISGASGAVIGIKLLEALRNEQTVLIVSQNAKKIIERETAWKYEQVTNMAKETYENTEMDAEIASGTSRFDTMIIAPCSTTTLAKIACGIGDNLLTRTASVALKERKKLIIVPRETPVSTPTLKRMYELSLYGAVIMPPVPAFYLAPENIDDVVNYIVGKILDHIGIRHNLYEPYRR
ncbi:MAG: UbiX family flavin prenyltransferase [Euryarchaeota archaeon]|nr:UbiX family flavin prenyltransferase [Euryarchaeota archaeon]